MCLNLLSSATKVAIIFVTLRTPTKRTMDITDFQKSYASHPCLKELKRAIDTDTTKALFIDGARASSAALFASCFIKSDQTVNLFVLDDLEEAGYFYHDMVQANGDSDILFFPSAYRRGVKHGQKDAANEILRTEVISRLRDAKSLAIVTFPDALAEKVVTKQSLEKNTLALEVGMTIGTDFITEVLEEYGFTKTDYVYEPGQFALRGSILDVFSYSSEYPFRVDFFGDEVDSIRSFEVDTQLSKEKKQSVTIVPELSEDDGESVMMLEFLPKEATVWVKDLVMTAERLSIVFEEAASVDADLSKFADGDEFLHRILDFRRIDFGSKPFAKDELKLQFDITIQPLFHKNFDLVSQALKEYINKGYEIYLCSDSPKQHDRLRDIFKDRGDNLVFTPVDKTLHEGFADNAMQMCVFTDHQIFDRFHKYSLRSEKARSGKVALSLKELNQFEPGDYVVHIDHGIGRFAGLVRIPNGNTTQEVIKLVYQNDDVVFVSIHSLHKISKYKGKEGEPPRISKLGTGAWEKVKERTKSKIKDIARDLIKLYSQRRQEKGFSFSPDSFMQQELEASFIYEDTPDQLKATHDVKADMESDRPMDRLVCGDVGFGKTEVAIRAAFKAVADNKQVAVLVPTTVLAYQHYQTFKKRLEDMPCKVDYLSRARNAKDSSRILKQLAAGEINILIGTHKIIGKSVKFKDLGLLIIDEEQKFGVSVKEKLRQIKVNVDTLTLTATPIPRTLQFSLMGARDLSVMQTPPPNRYPIQTELDTFNEGIITEAINYEMNRNGQVFFVNNRVQNLPELKEMILRNIPDCRVCIGHGQMPPEELEKVVLGFVNYDYDVLLATTIIENGIDIPNANTIIINQAHNFGLSDLHQMRGRVGRSNRKSFCYLLAPPLSSLNSEARRRLQAIENFSDLGSGIHIAMQDLDIRGAGNLLGAEQSGFIADLGYETYQKILSEAVTELKNDEFAELYADDESAKQNLSGDDFVSECTVESDLELLFPNEYIPNSSERMLLYSELDKLEEERDVEAFKSRLRDRFGKIPPEGEELIRIVSLRRMAKRLGIEKITLKAGKMILYFVSNIESPYYQSDTFGKVLNYMATHPRNCSLREKNGRRSMSVNDISTAEAAVNLLKEIK